MTIELFKHKELRKLFEDGNSRKIGKRFHARLFELLDIVNAATSFKDMVGIADFHRLKGNRRGECAMHVSGNWVLTFRFKDGEATDLNFEDYH